jgi:NAD(P)-dependent dehydrogenase (short-subunit alcohol dehydrogenase family)
MSTPRKPLLSQVVVITGATSCIGLATARMAARHGALLVLAASNAPTLDRLASDIRHAGGEVMTFPVDVSAEDEVAALGRAAMQRYGRVDTWINAGMAMDDGDDVKPAPVAARIFKSHYWGAKHGADIARSLMQGGGTIINLDSPGSARHGVKGCTDALRADIEAAGAPVSVTLIHAMLHAPHLVAEAILQAAQSAQRDVIVDGAMPAPAPRTSLLEKCLELLRTRRPLTPHLPAAGGIPRLFR